MTPRNILAILILGFVILFPSVTTLQKPITKPGQSPSFSARLIHRSSPENPLFDPHYSWEKFVRDGAANSLARSQHFALGQSKYEVAPLTDWSLIMKYSMGTPPVDMYGVLDTGSDLIWSQCLPCVRCSKLSDAYTFFNPKSSSSYQRLSCKGSGCKALSSRGTCSSRGECRYYYRYIGGDNSTGFLSTETMTIASLDDDYNESARTIKNVIFGCGDKSYVPHDLPGVFGVSNGSLSFIRQLNYPQFSYHIYAKNGILGGEAHFGYGTGLLENNFTTPLIPNRDGHFYLQLEGIRIDDDPIYIPPGTFDNSKDGRSGFVIDSGTTFTTIASAVYENMKQAIIELMMADFSSMPERYDQDQRWELCYWDVARAPQIEFEFTGIVFRLCSANQWVKMPNGLYCLAILRTHSRISILGIRQQRNVMVGYDLEKNLLSLLYPDSCPDDPIYDGW